MLYFGVLRDVFGGERDLVEVDAGATVGQLVTRVRGSRAGGVWQGLAVAVNREFAARDRVLADGDEVALLPPVSGGGR